MSLVKGFYCRSFSCSSFVQSRSRSGIFGVSCLCIAGIVILNPFPISNCEGWYLIFFYLAKAKNVICLVPMQYSRVLTCTSSVFSAILYVCLKCSNLRPLFWFSEVKQLCLEDLIGNHHYHVFAWSSQLGISSSLLCALILLLSLSSQ